MTEIKLKIIVIVFLFSQILLGTRTIRLYFQTTGLLQIFYVGATMYHFAIFSFIGVLSLRRFSQGYTPTLEQEEEK